VTLHTNTCEVNTTETKTLVTKTKKGTSRSITKI